jgi:high affinity cGMP-specific 3',5'-cyclic phosphodiesterase 9
MERSDVLAALIAALCHDLDHPGNNNAFEVNASTRLAVKYNDISVLENHHAATTFNLLQDPKFNPLVNVEGKTFTQMRKRMVKGILATDMIHVCVFRAFCVCLLSVLI